MVRLHRIHPPRATATRRTADAYDDRSLGHDERQPLGDAKLNGLGKRHLNRRRDPRSAPALPRDVALRLDPTASSAGTSRASRSRSRRWSQRRDGRHVADRLTDTLAGDRSVRVTAELTHQPAAVLVAQLERDLMWRDLEHVEAVPAEPVTCREVQRDVAQPSGAAHAVPVEAPRARRVVGVPRIVVNTNSLSRGSSSSRTRTGSVIAIVRREPCLGSVIVRVCAFHCCSIRIVSAWKFRSTQRSASSSPGRAADHAAVSSQPAKLGGVSSSAIAIMRATSA
jgi:hypothetical protein